MGAGGGLEYRGKNHETIGSDVLSLYRALQNPELVLGEDTAARIKAVDPNAWYPIEMMMAPVRALAASIGDAGLRKVGRTLFQVSHADKVRGRTLTAEDVLRGFDAIYHSANRGEDIGGWKVLRFDEDGAELENSTPHDCSLEEGLTSEALKTIGCSAHIEQTRCVKLGARTCVFKVTPTRRDARWMKR